MKTFGIISCCWLLSMLVCCELSGQNSDNGLKIIASCDDAGVILRWAPTDAASWHVANKKGYILQRARVPRTPAELQNYQYISIADTIRPWPSEKWADIVENDDYAATAWAALYQERPVIKGADLASTLHAQEDLKTKAHFLAMLAADHSQNAALGLGLAFVDKNIKRDDRYIYRVLIAGEEASEGLVFQDCSTEQVRPVPQKPETISEEKAVLVKWNVANDRNAFTSYFVERAENEGGPYKKLNTTPYIHLVTEGAENPALFRDSIGENYKLYYYRLVGMDPFARLSKPSEPVAGMGKDLTPPDPAVRVQAKVNQDNHVEVTWDKNAIEPDFAGFMVSRSDHYAGPFDKISETLLSRDTRYFTDKTPDYARFNYYIVQVVDTAGNISNSESAFAFFRDSIPPDAPQGLTGLIDSTGRVLLRWNRVEDPSLIGYRVYFSNSPDHTFIMRDGDLITDTFYTEKITLRTLSEKILYRVAAVDAGYGHSALSEVLELKKPDIIPPAPGVFKTWIMDKNRITLTWAPSSSEDARTQQIWRKKSGEVWQMLASLPMNELSYTDRNLESDTEYSYALKAVDDDGLESVFSTPITVSSYEFEELPPVRNLKIKWDEKFKAVQLTWDYSNVRSYEYIIYRGDSPAGLQSYDFVASVAQYTDPMVQDGAGYSYRVRVRNAKGDESPLSEEVKIQIPNREGK
ncbi:MAG: hypothetical protein IPM26_09805 [Saprospiraceae bacterium]|nr:hypothetical protein [Saprospiraceae bacterium]